MARTDKIGKTATNVYREIDPVNGIENTCIRYHSTVVVKFNRNVIVLNSGGWRTVTTKLRMNQASSEFGLGFSVYQKDYEWFVRANWMGGDLPFSDGMTLQRVS